MTTQTIQLKAEPRDGGASKTRAAEQVPAVLYGHGVANQSLAVDAKQFGKALSAAGYTALVDLAIGDNEHSVLIKEVQRHPTRSHVTHIDFYQVNLEEKVKADVSLTFTGEAPAVKSKGGIFLRNIDTLEVEALPRDLPRELTVDISSLSEYDDAVRIGDVALPDGVTVSADGDVVICLVQAPRTEEELEKLEEEVSEDVEGVEGVTKDEDGEGESESSDGGDTADEKPAEDASSGSE